MQCRIYILKKLKARSLFWLQAKSDVKTQAKLNAAATGKATPQSDSTAAKQGLNHLSNCETDFIFLFFFIVENKCRVTYVFCFYVVLSTAIVQSCICVLNSEFRL